MNFKKIIFILIFLILIFEFSNALSFIYIPNKSVFASTSNNNGSFSNIPLNSFFNDKHCTTIIFGKNATEDGSVIMAHTEDLTGNAVQYFDFVPKNSFKQGDSTTLCMGGKIPQVPNTHAYNLTKIFDKNLVRGDITSVINEHQVSIVNNVAFQREYKKPYPGMLVWTDLTRIAAERAETAREAVNVIGKLVSKYKFNGPGAMYGIIDPYEGWWMEITQDGQWAAQRVPDNSFLMRANTYRIGNINFNDSYNYMYSPDLVSYAQKRGWYKDADGAFNFSAVFSDPSEANNIKNTHRHEIVENLVNGLLSKNKITIKDLMNVLRNHYEGTQYDKTDAYKNGSPHTSNPEYTVCNSTTDLAIIVQSRKWLPPEIGCVRWTALGNPCTSVFTPWYFAQKEYPPEFKAGTLNNRQNSAYWAFRNLCSIIDKDYKNKIESISQKFASYEKMLIDSQYCFENNIQDIYFRDKNSAVSYMSIYSNRCGLEAYNMALELQR